MHKEFVRPMPGRKVRKPDGTVVPAEGCVVTWSSYWLRREKDRDIERVAAPAPAEPPVASDPVTQGGDQVAGKHESKEKV